MAQPNELKTLYEGRHLSMARRGHWEFVSRNTKKPAVKRQPSHYAGT